MAKYGSAVTDPSLIAELEGNQQQPVSQTAMDMSKYKAVNDPNVLTQLNQPEDLSNAPQKSLLQQIGSYLPNPPEAGIPPTLNAITGLMSLESKDPMQQKAIANLPQVAMGVQPTNMENIEHSIGRNLPSFAIPEAKGASFPVQALSRILGQSGWGALSSNNPMQGAKEFGLTQSGLEILPALGKPLQIAAEAINPMKYAGETAEKIRNLAQAGYDKAMPYYESAKKYFDNNVTPTPKKYLGFTKEDRAYFNAPTKKSYNDFVADPTLGNLHDFQSKMGAQPDLGGWREGIKDKIASFLKQDPKALEEYKKGSDIMRDEYYPYVSNDTLSDIVSHKKPIKEFDPNALDKALQNTPLVNKSSKLETPIQHPIIDLANDFKDRMNSAKLYQYGMPAMLGGIAGHFVEPGMGSVLGSMAGSAFGKWGEPQLLKLAQNPALLSKLEYLRQALQGAGRGAVGYNMYGQQ